jgi:hypothetical protein
MLINFMFDVAIFIECPEQESDVCDNCRTRMKVGKMLSDYVRT